VQIAGRSENAVIRLDPPMLGQVEIVVRHEGGAIHVELNASHSEVRSQLQSIGETLRQELSQRHQGTVSVHVGHGARDDGQQQRSQRPQGDEPRTPGRALGDPNTGSAFALPEDRT